MKTAWVTGGSSGIGLELTKRLLKDNFQVCIFAHAGIEQAVADLQKIACQMVNSILRGAQEHCCSGRTSND